MDVEHVAKDLEDLETNPRAVGAHLPAVIKGFRKRMQNIRAAVDVRDLYAVKGNRFEKLGGSRKGQHSLVLTGNYRLIVEVVDSSQDVSKIRVIEIVDYH